MRRVAFQGAPGSYSEEAVRRACGADVTAVSFRETRDVVRAVADGSVDLAVLPVENSIAGAVSSSIDAIEGQPGIRTVGEVTLAIHHCVVGLPGSTLASIRSIESHPIALAQCGLFLARHTWLEVRAAYDTAGAAEDIARAGDPTRAAIASASAAKRYGLEILATEVEDRPENNTRFVVLGRAMRPRPETRVGRWRT